ncbi:hypothetical protein HZS_4079 [Henneguya salminicola]|nr:hypothetical protein HZS_4079 [Henneguya salminicola]
MKSSTLSRSASNNIYDTGTLSNYLTESEEKIDDGFSNFIRLNLKNEEELFNPYCVERQGSSRKPRPVLRCKSLENNRYDSGTDPQKTCPHESSIEISQPKTLDFRTVSKVGVLENILTFMKLSKNKDKKKLNQMSKF